MVRVDMSSPANGKLSAVNAPHALLFPSRLLSDTESLQLTATNTGAIRCKSTVQWNRCMNHNDPASVARRQAVGMVGIGVPAASLAGGGLRSASRFCRY